MRKIIIRAGDHRRKKQASWGIDSKKELGREILNNYNYLTGLGSSLQVLGSRWAYGGEVSDQLIDGAIEELEELIEGQNISPTDEVGKREELRIRNLQQKIRNEKSQNINL